MWSGRAAVLCQPDGSLGGPAEGLSACAAACTTTKTTYRSCRVCSELLEPLKLLFGTVGTIEAHVRDHGQLAALQKCAIHPLLPAMQKVRQSRPRVKYP